MRIVDCRPGQSVLIGPNIRIVVTKVRTAKVALGIEAPLDYAIVRSEAKAQGRAGLPGVTEDACPGSPRGNSHDN